MKKLLLLITMLLNLTLGAQTLVDTGKVWTVVECLNFGGCGTPVFYFQGDTTIGSYQYKKLILNSDSGYTALPIPIAAREDSTKKVYFYFNAGEYLYYNFALNQGDTFTTIINGCGFQMTVDSVDTVTLLNGETRKRMFLSNFWQETWIEGIGSLYGLTYVGVYFCSFDIYPELNCFTENDTLKYHNINYNSCYFNTVGITELFSKNNFILFPNPFYSSTTLNVTEIDFLNSVMKVYNIFGEEVQRHSILNGQLTIKKESLTDGIYFFRLSNNKNQMLFGKFIID